MKIGPSPKVGLSRFARPHDRFEVYSSQPRDVCFCGTCNVSNEPISSNKYAPGASSTKVSMSFSEGGVCHACRFIELKEDPVEIDWDERECELLDLCDRFRKDEDTPTSSIIEQDNNIGCQFHRAKSADVGVRPIARFLKA